MHNFGKNILLIGLPKFQDFSVQNRLLLGRKNPIGNTSPVEFTFSPFFSKCFFLTIDGYL